MGFIKVALKQSSVSFIDCQLISAVYFSLFKIIIAHENILPTMNSHPYGIAKQLYRTSYSPAVESSRPSSLNNPNFSQYQHPPMLQLRPDMTGTTLLVSKNNLLNSQSLKLDQKPKLQNSDYYQQPLKLDDVVKQMQAKIEEISKKVMKNTEDIKTIKLNTKNDPPQLSFASELERLNKRQEAIQRDCFEKITELKTQILETSKKLLKFESDQCDKLNLRIQEKQMIKIRNLVEERVKQETIKIKLIIENEINKMSNELRTDCTADSSNTPPIKSRLKYPFRSTKLTYSQFLKSDKIKDSSRVSTKQSSQSPRSSKVLMSNQQTYYIDKEGFLLDQNNYYLLDKDERMIRLTSAMIQELRREGLLQNDC